MTLGLIMFLVCAKNYFNLSLKSNGIIRGFQIFILISIWFFLSNKKTKEQNRVLRLILLSFLTFCRFERKHCNLQVLMKWPRIFWILHDLAKQKVTTMTCTNCKCFTSLDSDLHKMSHKNQNTTFEKFLKEYTEMENKIIASLSKSQF